MAKFGVGQPVKRVEDQRFITGSGRYTDDINLDGQCYGVVLRSPEAHARIDRIDTKAALAVPGVVAVLTGADAGELGKNALPCLAPMPNRDGTDGSFPLRPVICEDVVRHVGDHVAFVVADTLAAARDAAELVEVEYTTLDAVASTAGATEPGRPRVHPEIADNLSFDWEHGDREAAERALAGAAHITELTIVNNRLVANSMEPRAVVAEYDAGADTMTLHACSQGVWDMLGPLSSALGMKQSQVKVMTPDVGGGFGMKAFFYPEYAMAAWAARKLGRPVKWTAERSSDAFVSDVMGRDHVTVAKLGLDAEHRITGLVVETTANMGAYTNCYAPFIPTGAALKVLPGVYDVKQMVYRVRGVLTNTTPVDAYRGAGRPESIYLIERLIDQAGRETGIGPVEIRRRNFIGAASMPFKTTAGELYDSGEFDRVMSATLDAADTGGFAARKAESERRGLKRGWGLSYYIESTMGAPEENAKIMFDDDGSVRVAVGTQSNGQGHATAYAQVLSDRLGVPFDKIRLVEGDSTSLPSGGGTGGSRSLTAEGLAIRAAADAVIERGKHYASAKFEAAVADIEFNREAGEFAVVGTDRKVTVIDLALEAKSLPKPAEVEDDAGLDALATATIDAWTFPNGCHITEVEVDPETGVVHVDRYHAVDDFGVVVNPMLVEGQVHGGVVQGIGQALLEHAVFDDEGQLIAGSFMDYCMPRADDVPPMHVVTEEVPCKTNDMGVKGCGEAGSVASPAAVINAIIDALGVDAIDMPATPEVVWKAAQSVALSDAAE